MKQIIVSGFGGQGVISLGLMLAYAALQEEKNTSFLPSYGPEMRGGTANCSVVISEKEVASPVISRPDILVAFNGPSLTRFLPQLAQGGKAFADAAHVKAQKNVLSVPAEELCGGGKGQNIVMLGAILPAVGLRLTSAQAAVREVFKHKPQFLESNLACLQKGWEFAQTL